MERKYYLSFSFWILITIVFIQSCANPRLPLAKEVNERVYMGKVKKIVTLTCNSYIPDYNDIIILDKSCYIKKIEEFNKDEVLIGEVNFDDDNNPSLKTRITTTISDSRGNIIEKTSITDYIFHYTVRWEYKYNENDLLVEEIQYNDNTFTQRSKFIYDKYNCMIEEQYFDKSNQFKYKFISEYDNNNLRIKRTQYYPQDEFKGYSTREYDSKGKLLRERWYNSKKELTEDNDYRDKPTDKKDANNNLIEYIDYKGLLHIKQFDNNNRCIEEQILDKEKWIETNTWSYREDGALIESTYSTSKAIGKSFYKVTSKYKNDNHGNWIEKFTINNEDKTVVGLEKKYIEYFED